MHRIPVYVPRGVRLAARIDPKSAIVGSNAEQWLSAKYGAGDAEPTASGSALMLDFEGNRFGAVNMVTFADRARHAAGRHDRHYPTVARCVAEPADVVHAGWFYPEYGRVEVENAEQLVALSKWLDVDHDQLALEMRCTEGVRA